MKLKILITKIFTRRDTFFKYVNFTASSVTVNEGSYKHISATASVPSGYSAIGVCRIKSSSAYITTYRMTTTAAGAVTIYVGNSSAANRSVTMSGSVLCRRN